MKTKYSHEVGDSSPKNEKSVIIYSPYDFLCSAEHKQYFVDYW